MIVQIIDQDRILTFKLECKAPVSTDTDRPMISEFSRKRMKFPSWSVHVDRAPGIVESKQLQTQLSCVLRLYPSTSTRCERISPRLDAGSS
jgi:hypothetical protein